MPLMRLFIKIVSVKQKQKSQYDFLSMYEYNVDIINTLQKTTVVEVKAQLD